MNNQEKFTTRSSNLKVHRANSKTMSSYPIRFSTDILFSFLVSFAFFVFFFCVCVKLKIYSLIHIQLCGQVSDKKFSPGRFPETRLLFFWPKLVRLVADFLSKPLLIAIDNSIISSTFPNDAKIASVVTIVKYVISK